MQRKKSLRLGLNILLTVFQDSRGRFSTRGYIGRNFAPRLPRAVFKGKLGGNFESSRIQCLVVKYHDFVIADSEPSS
jgi:hypothetical protein